MSASCDVLFIREFMFGLKLAKNISHSSGITCVDVIKLTRYFCFLFSCIFTLRSTFLRRLLNTWHQLFRRPTLLPIPDSLQLLSCLFSGGHGICYCIYDGNISDSGCNIVEMNNVHITNIDGITAETEIESWSLM